MLKVFFDEVHFFSSQLPAEVSHSIREQETKKTTRNTKTTITSAGIINSNDEQPYSILISKPALTVATIQHVQCALTITQEEELL